MSRYSIRVSARHACVAAVALSIGKNGAILYPLNTAVPNE